MTTNLQAGSTRLDESAKVSSGGSGDVSRPHGALYEHAIGYEKESSIADNEALVAYLGVKTGRSPKDKRVVKHQASENEVWWGPVNIPLEPHTFAINRERACDYLNTRSGFTALMASPAGIPITRSRSGSSARGHITRFSCTPCSSDPLTRSLRTLVNRTLPWLKQRGNAIPFLALKWSRSARAFRRSSCYRARRGATRQRTTPVRRSLPLVPRGFQGI